jgi:putative flippase GtrA
MQVLDHGQSDATDDQTPQGRRGLHRELNLAEFARFLMAGLAVCVVDFSVYFAALWIAPALPVALAKALAFVLGATTSFLINRRFVFRAGGQAQRQVGRFALLYGSTLTLNVAVNALVLHFGADKPLAWLVATAASTVANFTGMKFVVFRSSP